MNILSQEEALPVALSLLKKKGSVLLVPTETVYGLICAADDVDACRKIYELKHRPTNKLLANFVSSVEIVKNKIGSLPSNACILAEHFCPGPLTIVVPDGKNGTFGFRIPDHPFVLELLNRFHNIIASTSANLSGTPAALSVPEALSTLSGEPDLSVDGGKISDNSVASTVVQFFSDNSWKILRNGPISFEDIQNVISMSN